MLMVGEELCHCLLVMVGALPLVIGHGWSFAIGQLVMVKDLLLVFAHNCSFGIG